MNKKKQISNERVLLSNTTKEYTFYELGDRIIEGCFSQWEGSIATKIKMKSDNYKVLKVFYCNTHKHLEIRVKYGSTCSVEFDIKTAKSEGVKGIEFTEKDDNIKVCRVLYTDNEKFNDDDACVSSTASECADDDTINQQPETRQGSILM